MENVRVGLHFLNRRKLKSCHRCHSKYFLVGLDFEVARSCSYFGVNKTSSAKRSRDGKMSKLQLAGRLPAMDVLATTSCRPYARHRPRVLGHSPPAGDGHADDTGART